jgi:nitrate reductase gamma subunit
LDAFSFIILPYIAVAVFFLGTWLRIVSWIKTPQPGKMVLSPWPKGGIIGSLIKEAILFPSLFKGNRPLWVYSWLFHAALTLIVLGHLRVFTSFIDTVLSGWGVNVQAMSSSFGGAAGIVIIITVLLLLLRRFLVKSVREITNFADFFALILLLAIITTGNSMRFGDHFDLNITREYFSHLFTFSFAGMVIPENPVFRAHFFSVLLLMMYIPFSKILHFGGIFFTQSLIKRA